MKKMKRLALEAKGAGGEARRGRFFDAVAEPV
jgi:hypothetical protein